MERLVVLPRVLAFASGWLARHRRYRWVWLGLLLMTLLTNRGLWSLIVLGAFVPMSAALWATASPTSYERWAAGPGRRRGWRRWLTRGWPELARQCGIARQVPTIHKVRGQRVEHMEWQAPALFEVTTSAHTITARIECAPGQTVRELRAGAERLATMAGAESFHTQQVGPSTIELSLLMLNQLAVPVEATPPLPLRTVDSVPVGRTSTGDTWELPLRGRHTLVVGASGAGKGSVLWGICGGLAPAVAEDRARLWGIDLKRGVELAMGKGLFSALVLDPERALQVLRKLIEVIDERGAQMIGKSRLHLPTPGDPLHVLVIDELAILTAYGDSATTKEANRLLGEILTQGRALGVVVLACVQDPRKEVVGLRGLFTQTVAMRLRSAVEVSMVLGDGMAESAPAHEISPSDPGTAWIVEDNGNCAKVRADFWPDSLVRQVAKDFRTRTLIDLPAPSDDADTAASEATAPRTPRARSPRKPRPRRGATKPSEIGEAA